MRLQRGVSVGWLVSKNDTKSNFFSIPILPLLSVCLSVCITNLLILSRMKCNSYYITKLTPYSYLTTTVNQQFRAEKLFNGQ